MVGFSSIGGWVASLDGTPGPAVKVSGCVTLDTVASVLEVERVVPLIGFAGFISAAWFEATGIDLAESFLSGFDFVAGALDLEDLVVILVDGFAPASFKSKSELIY